MESYCFKMDTIEYQQVINGHLTKVILIFDKYQERQYKKDFADFVSYQKKQSLTGEVGETYFKFLKSNELSYIPYKKFRDDSARLFSQVLFYLLKNNPHIIVSETLNIQIRLIHNSDGSFSYDDEVSDAENACFEGGGRWFLQAVSAPFAYTQKIDFSYIFRFFLHELTHFVDHMHNYLLFESKYSSKIRRFSQKKSNYSLNYLFNSLFNLREEGFADFMARKNSPKIDINMKGVKEYNRHLVKLVKITRKAKAETFYEKKIGWENLTASGEYTAGRNMCLFIALSLAKSKKLSYSIVAGSQKMEGYDYPLLDRYLAQNKVIYIQNLSSVVMNEAIAQISLYQGFEFIKFYEKACDYLAITEKNRIMTRQRANSLQKMAIEFAVAERQKRLKKKYVVS